MPAVKKNVTLIHWRAKEAQPLIELMESAGYQVHYAGDQKLLPRARLREIAPLAAVVDLSRMPSYGRYWAAEVRASKSLKHIPIVFVGGDAERVTRVKAAIPDAEFTTHGELKRVLRSVKPLLNPVAPVRMMASDKSAAVKMGIKANSRVAVFDPPSGYANVIGTLPTGASFEEDPREPLPISVWFVREMDAYLAGLREMRKVAASSKLWIVYPKLKPKQSGGLNQNSIRESANRMGLVDYKICSVNETWSGMAFALRK